MSGSLLTDEVRSMIGREVVYVAPEPIGRASFRYFAQAIGDHNPVYTDDAAAQRAGWRGVIAPPTLICETNQYCTGTPSEDGYLGHEWDIGPEGARRVRGGNRYELHQPVHEDDVVTATWRIDDVVEKAASSGEPMLVVSSVAVYTNQRGEVLATNRETIIIQPRSGGAS